MDGIELPLGTQFKTMVDGEFVTVVVKKGNGCSGCVYSHGCFLCWVISCEALERADRTNVIIEKLEGGENG